MPTLNEVLLNCYDIEEYLDLMVRNVLIGCNYLFMPYTRRCFSIPVEEWLQTFTTNRQFYFK